MPAQQSAGWCAVNPANGLLHTSNWTLTTVLRYQVDFTKLISGRPFLTQTSSLPLRDEYGAALSLPHVQGDISGPTASGSTWSTGSWMTPTATRRGDPGLRYRHLPAHRPLDQRLRGFQL